MKKDVAFELLHQFILAITPLPKEEWVKLLGHLTFSSFKAGEHLISQGEGSAMVYFVTHGLVRTYFTENEGKEVTKGFAWEGRLASPYVAILSGKPSNFSIIALENTFCVEWDYSKTKHLYGEHLSWQEFGRKVAENLLIEREYREFQMLVLSATERYENFLKDYKIILDRIPQYEIASYLGITPVALSNIRREIKQSR